MTILASLASRLDQCAAFIVGLSGWRRMLAAFLFGVASALAMAPVYALPLLAVGLTGLALLIDGAAGRKQPKRSGLAVGWFWGFGYFLAGIYWMAFSFFVQADQFAWMAPFAIAGMPAFLGIFTGLAALICVAGARRGWARIFYFAAVFAIVEYARGHIMTGLPWNLTGQALAGSAIGAQTAAWVGAYGLSLVAIFFAAAPASSLNCKSPAPLTGLYVSLIGFALIYAVGGLRLSMPEPHGDGRTLVRIVQPNIPQREKIEPGMWARNFERQLDHSIGAAPPGAQLFIIWPENGAPRLDEARSALAVLSAELPEKSVLIAGAVRAENLNQPGERWFNSIAVVEETPQGREVTGHYDKHHLVPFGEYLPFYDLLDKIGLAQLTPYGDAGFASGEGPAVMAAGGTVFAPMICYEAIFPHASYPPGARPQWLVTVTNDAWFGDTSGPRQHLDMARLRSVETGLPMARSANTGVSALIDGKGRVLARIPLYHEGKIDAPLPPPLSRPLYDRLGDWPFAIITLVFLGLSTVRVKLRGPVHS